MKRYTFPYRFRKALDWLLLTEEQLESCKTPNVNWIEDRVKLVDNIKSLKRLLEDYRISLSAEEERNRVLDMIIDAKLKTKPNITYVCKHCDFRGKEYRDFCPGCKRDDKGKTSADYLNSQKDG